MIDLKAIKERAAAVERNNRECAHDSIWVIEANRASAADVPGLVAEVEKLRQLAVEAAAQERRLCVETIESVSQKSALARVMVFSIVNAIKSRPLALSPVEQP